MNSFILSILVLAHPIHISVTEIEYNEKNKSLEIVSRIFIDDLELSIRNRKDNHNLEILSPPKDQSTDQLVKEYLKDQLDISADNKVLKINYLGHEIEDLSIVCYMEVEQMKKFKSIKVTNRAITETHDDQSNLVHVTLSGKVRSLRLMKDSPTGKLDFE